MRTAIKLNWIAATLMAFDVCCLLYIYFTASVNPSEYPFQRELKLPGILSTGNYPKIGGA
jgi:hypothetical protein